MKHVKRSNSEGQNVNKFILQSILAHHSTQNRKTLASRYDKGKAFKIMTNYNKIMYWRNVAHKIHFK